MYYRMVSYRLPTQRPSICRTWSLTRKCISLGRRRCPVNWPPPESVTLAPDGMCSKQRSLIWPMVASSRTPKWVPSWWASTNTSAFRKCIEPERISISRDACSLRPTRMNDFRWRPASFPAPDRWCAASKFALDAHHLLWANPIRTFARRWCSTTRLIRLERWWSAIAATRTSCWARTAASRRCWSARAFTSWRTWPSGWRTSQRRTRNSCRTFTYQSSAIYCRIFKCRTSFFLFLS